MPTLDLGAQRADVVVGSAELSDQEQPVQAGFFPGFSKDGLFGRLSPADGTAWYLDSGLFVRLVDRAYDQEPVAVEDVGQRLVHHGLAVHRAFAFAGELVGRAYVDVRSRVLYGR